MGRLPGLPGLRRLDTSERNAKLEHCSQHFSVSVGSIFAHQIDSFAVRGVSLPVCFESHIVLASVRSLDEAAHQSGLVRGPSRSYCSGLSSRLYAACRLSPAGAAIGFARPIVSFASGCGPDPWIPIGTAPPPKPGHPICPVRHHVFCPERCDAPVRRVGESWRGLDVAAVLAVYLGHFVKERSAVAGYCCIPVPGLALGLGGVVGDALI